MMYVAGSEKFVQSDGGVVVIVDVVCGTPYYRNDEGKLVYPQDTEGEEFVSVAPNEILDRRHPNMEVAKDYLKEKCHPIALFAE